MVVAKVSPDCQRSCLFDEDKDEDEDEEDYLTNLMSEEEEEAEGGHGCLFGTANGGQLADSLTVKRTSL